MSAIGTANYQTFDGIHDITVTWTGRSGTSRSGTLLTVYDKEAQSDDSQTVNNVGEIQRFKTRNDRMQFRFVIKPTAADAAGAKAILGDLPKRKSLVTLTGDAADTDLSAAGSILVEAASTSQTPENEAVVNLTVVKHYGKTFVALS